MIFKITTKTNPKITGYRNITKQKETICSNYLVTRKLIKLFEKKF